MALFGSLFPNAELQLNNIKIVILSRTAALTAALAALAAVRAAHLSQRARKARLRQAENSIDQFVDQR